MRPILLALLLLAVPGAARAGCQVNANAVAFGAVRPGQQASGTGRLVVSCDQATRMQVGIAAASGTRTMRGPGNAKLAYDLFQDAGHRTRWGSGRADGSARPAAVAARRDTTMTVYGVIPKQPGVPPGTYVDNLTVSVDF
jgi:spore coat protein U-like protein